MSVDLKGNEVRVEQTGREVQLVFVAKSVSEADKLREEIIAQLKSGGGFHLTLTGFTRVTD